MVLSLQPELVGAVAPAVHHAVLEAYREEGEREGGGGGGISLIHQSLEEIMSGPGTVYTPRRK